MSKTQSNELHDLQYPANFEPPLLCRNQFGLKAHWYINLRPHFPRKANCLSLRFTFHSLNIQTTHLRYTTTLTTLNVLLFQSFLWSSIIIHPTLNFSVWMNECTEFNNNCSPSLLNSTSGQSILLLSPTALEIKANLHLTFDLAAHRE